MKRPVSVIWIFGVILAGCKDDAQCERQRLQVNRAWSELHLAATRRKLEGSDVPTWAAIENRAELLESSFETAQVTWESARKASQDIAAKLPGLESGDARLVGFKASFDSALKQQNDFEKTCR